MAKVQITFEFEATDRDDAVRQTRWFMERRILPLNITIQQATADGDNLLTADQLLAKYRFCLLCLSGQHRPGVHL